MKKFFYTFSLVFFLFIGINGVKAADVSTVCYYKSDDNKLNFAVKVYSDNSVKAYLIKSYSTSDGYDDAHKYGDKFDVDNWTTGSSCSSYLKYGINVFLGFNKITASSTVPSTGDNEYVLKNYNFNALASTCKYKTNYLDDDSREQIVTYQIYNSAIVTEFNDNINTILDTYKDKSYTWEADTDNFATEFYDDSKCPTLSIYGTTGYFTIKAGTDGEDNIDLVSSNYNKDSSFDGESSNEVSMDYDFKDRLPAEATVSFVADSKGKEKFCITLEGETRICNDVVDGEDTYVDFYVNNSKYRLYLFSQYKNVYFQYSDSNDPLTLIKISDDKVNVDWTTEKKDPTSSSPGSYYITPTATENSEEAITHTDSEKYQMLTGDRFLYWLEQLKTPLVEMSSSVLNYPITLKGVETKFSDSSIEYGYDICGSGTNLCSSNLEYYVNSAIEDMTNYCNMVYSKYNYYNSTDPDNAEQRINECISFSTFYDKLVSNGIVNDSRTEGCGFISEDLQSILKWAFRGIEIAGPVIAIVLGMLDFVKVIVNNDADKEIKTAWKRLLYRLIAAALLFVIPILLAWMMDIVLKDQGTGYDSSNPYCGMTEWSENG